VIQPSGDRNRVCSRPGSGFHEESKAATIAFISSGHTSATAVQAPWGILRTAEVVLNCREDEVTDSHRRLGTLQDVPPAAPELGDHGALHLDGFVRSRKLSLGYGHGIGNGNVLRNTQKVKLRSAGRGHVQEPICMEFEGHGRLVDKFAGS